MESSTTELFETLNSSKLKVICLLYTVIVLLFLVLSTLLPPYTDYQQSETIKNISANHITLFTEMRDLSKYIKSADFGFFSRSQFWRPYLLTVNGSFSESINGSKYIYTNLPERDLVLRKQTYKPLIKRRRRSTTDIEGTLTLEIADGIASNILFIWRIRSSIFVFASILARSFFFMLFALVAFNFRDRISKLKNKNPTSIQVYLSKAVLVYGLISIPACEYSLIGLIRFPKDLRSNLDFLTTLVFFWVFLVTSFGLTKRFQTDEMDTIRLFAKVILVLLFGCVCCICVHIPDERFSKFLGFVPYIPLGLSLVGIFACPFNIEAQLPEFHISLVQAYLAFVCGVEAFWLIASQSERFSTFSIFHQIVESLSMMILVILHWPYDESGYDARYLKQDEQNNGDG